MKDRMTVGDIEGILLDKKNRINRELAKLPLMSQMTPHQAYEDMFLSGAVDAINYILKAIDNNEENEHD
jgi:hypothetical protein